MGNAVAAIAAMAKAYRGGKLKRDRTTVRSSVPLCSA